MSVYFWESNNNKRRRRVLTILNGSHQKPREPRLIWSAVFASWHCFIFIK